ncbi:MAG TPA: sigma-54 dependent transcriptional regulator [Acidiphilium sp.]|uniref:sigma-54-dependent transcriptional regulator n=1 Tax=unclassified Acidiphilium TaxID=2617493 RepID=UPI000BDACF37|nr:MULTISPECIES: sigma-54 dependent transcriptional regulator [unclassified Acidiphilium]OYV56695.1 MAG: sigma-54-dependent Fis family transcriptional regulator [Acidiphilium sp. 20-67-58]HQT60861.1 sigma-54 dependent transcriptional regulator [Acidiphilium sp.]HQU10120.1 sigma-54 dependent transcriptional regulator [Acidiphilium sp.]
MRVLIIGSLSGELGVAARIAASRGATLAQAETIDAALHSLRTDARTDLIICDVKHDLCELMKRLVAERFTTMVVAAGAEDDEDAAVDAIRAGAREYLPLPPDSDLIAAILSAVSAEQQGEFIARDPAMRAVLAQADQVAQSTASILIMGESGTGKEVLARYIHGRSRRSKGAFVALNCAAIPDTLLESELFGHEKGAFSGAIARRAGKFEAADRGTLLLDEIGEMDVRLQAKLLRTLQERTVDRLGGDRPVPVDVRILAATNADLGAAITDGRFREDLFFRLNVVTLRIPPLRQRPDDIAPLAHHFVAHYARLNEAGVKHLTSRAVERLLAHTWRGNVRELENTMHRAVLLSPGPMIDVEHIGLSGEARDQPGMLDAGEALASGGTIGALVGRRVEDVEQALILETLNRCLGNRTHAATILGISIRALRNKLRDYATRGADVPAPHNGVAA